MHVWSAEKKEKRKNMTAIEIIVNQHSSRRDDSNAHHWKPGHTWENPKWIALARGLTFFNSLSPNRDSNLSATPQVRHHS